jgi:hypothetical protein
MDPVFALANEDPPQFSGKRNSAEHFFRFEFSADTIAAAKASPVCYITVIFELSTPHRYAVRCNF